MSGQRGFLTQAQTSAIELARVNLYRVPCHPSEAYDEALRQFVFNVYGCLEVEPPPTKIYRFASPLACMLAIPRLSSIHSSPFLHLMTDCKNAFASSIGETEKINRRVIISGFVSAALNAPKEDQLSELFTQAFVRQMREQCGGEDGDYTGLVSLPDMAAGKEWWNSIHAGGTWIWPYSGFVVACDAPIRVELDNRERPHCENDAAIEFDDGYRAWIWHGVVVPKQAILFPEAIGFDHVEKETNLEVRRIMIERMGPGKYLRQAGAVLQDMDSLTLDGSAPRALMKDKLGNKWLVGTDGSTARVYTMAVPAEAKTCREAHEMIAGFDESRLIAEA